MGLEQQIEWKFKEPVYTAQGDVVFDKGYTLSTSDLNKINRRNDISKELKEQIKAKKIRTKFIFESKNNLCQVLEESSHKLKTDMTQSGPNYIFDKEKYMKFASFTRDSTKALEGIDNIEKYITNKNYEHNIRTAELSMAIGLKLGYGNENLKRLYFTAALKDCGLVKKEYEKKHLDFAKDHFYTTGKKISPLDQHIKNTQEVLSENKYNQSVRDAIGLIYNIEPEGNANVAREYAKIVRMADEFVRLEEKEQGTYEILKTMKGKYDSNLYKNMVKAFARPSNNMQSSYAH